MTIVVELSMPADAVLPLLEPLCGIPGVRVTADTLVPMSTAALPYVWVAGVVERFERRVREADRIRDYERATSVGDRVLFWLDWATDTDAVLADLEETRYSCLYARGDENGWEFRLRFPTHEALAQYVSACEAHGVDVDVARLVTFSEDREEREQFGLTAKQFEAIDLATRRGYFDSPRGTSLEELSDELGISKQALSQRIRPAVHKILTDSLTGTTGRERT